ARDRRLQARLIGLDREASTPSSLSWSSSPGSSRRAQPLRISSFRSSGALRLPGLRRRGFYAPPNLPRLGGSATMSFNTPVTPGILATASCAARRSSSLRTLPLRVTYPSVAETKICLSLVTGFARNDAFACAFTLRYLVIISVLYVA